jgi:hypothetical protein
MAYPNIEAILEEGGDITVGRVGPIECVASASTSYDCPVMLVRRKGESFARSPKPGSKRSRLMRSTGEGIPVTPKSDPRASARQTRAKQGRRKIPLPILSNMGTVDHGAGNLC